MLEVLKGFKNKISQIIRNECNLDHKLINDKILKSNIKHTYGDQKGQVDFLINNVLNYEKNGLPKDGFFIDLACADGVYWNNTYFLEKYLNWNGLLFEPNPRYEEC